MSYTTLWSKTTITSRLLKEYLVKHGHLLKTKSYKENVLEIGCADGSITNNILFPYMENYVEKWIAIDKLEGMIESAKQNNSNEKIEFKVMDAMNAQHVNEMAGAFDHIFANYVAHWIPDNRTFLNGLHKMLKPRGQVFLTIMADHAVTQSFVKHLRTGTWSNYLLHEKFLVDYTENPSNYFRNLVKDCGFKVDVCEHKEGTDITENFPDMVRALVLMSRSIHLIPTKLQEIYIQDHIKNSCELCKYIREPDVYDVPYNSMICIASKDS